MLYYDVLLLQKITNELKLWEADNTRNSYSLLTKNNHTQDKHKKATHKDTSYKLNVRHKDTSYKLNVRKLHTESQATS